ncbi:hypothetical protein IFM89_005675 [Coptis chinensis]|uniref:Pentatricopeptide repeat-containing protein n=1 Tax=Coptis chinensis TaxID=261450 RepID=A0A835LB18_9MAGN|nr:hypothetical protein IFM89_005675 [Coptis chinensis]
MGEGDFRTVKSLNALLFACLIGKKYDEVKSIFVEFPKRYGIQCNLDTFNTVIKAFSESGNTSSVYSILAEMDRKRIEPNATTFSTMLAGFYKEEKDKDVGNVLVLMKQHGVKLGLSTYNIRIQSLCKLNKSGEAKALLFEEMLARGGDFENALRACKVSMLKQWFPNFATMKMLVDGLVSISKVEEARELVGKMKERFTKVDMWKEIEEGLPQPQ